MLKELVISIGLGFILVGSTILLITSAKYISENTTFLNIIITSIIVGLIIYIIKY